MKAIRKLKKFTKCKAMLVVALLGMSLSGYAATDLYIDVADDGTETTTHFKTFASAVARANSVGGEVIIHLRKNTVETSSCTINSGTDIKLVADNGTKRLSIQYAEQAHYANARLIGMAGGSLTIGGNNAEGNKGVVIIRGLRTDGHEFYSPYSNKTWVLLYVSGNATLNILNNTEIAYGKNNIWIDSPNATVNLGLDDTRDFGVIHSAESMNVNITAGTFNMNSGYIVGHCNGFYHGTYPYQYPVHTDADNSILNRDAFINSTFPNDYLDMFDVSRALTDYYPTNTIDYNGKEYSNSMNRAIAVYAHCTTTASGEPAAVFNMNGGKICGIFAAGKRAIIGRTGTNTYTSLPVSDDDIYEFFEYNFEHSQSRTCRPSAVVIYGGTGEISGGEMYANVSTFCGGGIIFSGDGFDATNFNETFDHGHFLISGGLINYCQAPYGGAARSEYGVVLEMTGGKWSHCVANQGGGGVRVVCAKFIMSGTAEICYNHLSNLTENRNGGGIAGTWNPEFGHIYSWIELNGGKLYKNISDNYGGGLSAHDGGAAVDNGGIKAIIDGCEIYENTAVISGGGVFVGGNGDVTIKGDSYIHDNTAAEAGGGVYSSSEFLTAGNRSKVDISVCEISNNSAPLGGAVYSFKSDVEVHAGADIHSNTASDKGGGIYITEGADYYQDGGVIGKSGFPNTSNEGGGVYMNGGVMTMEGGTISYNTATKNETNEGGNGGGFYVTGGLVNVAGGFIRNNVADVSGGGFYVDAASTTDTTFIKGGAQVIYNRAQNGGGAYISNGILSIEETGTAIAYDTAYISGGGIYMANGMVYDTLATLSGNVSRSSNGGAFYIGDGSIMIAKANITDNSAPNGNGGGVYVGAGNGVVTLKDGATVSGNTAINGGGLCVNGGSILYDHGTITGNTATGNGGGIYANADVAFNGGTVSENTAQSGGGLYANAGTVDFSSGMFSQNGASANGGGIYLNAGATLNLTDEATISKNHVPAGGAGGGVYLGGTLNVGKNADDPVGTHSLMAHDNYAGTPSDFVLNNIFLPNETKYITLLSDISGVNDETGFFYTRLGFSVTRGFCPVVYTDISGGNASHEAWLANLMGSSTTLTGAIFDDANKYPALHMPEDHGPILAKYIWLWGCWTTEVTSNPGPDHFTVDHEGTNVALVHIKSNRGLAWFTSYVNGLNGCDQHHDVDAVLEADVDMSEFLWVPIGAVSAATVDPTTHNTVFTDGGFYGGEFDGHGHTIEGLQCFYLNAIPKIGLFGYLDDGIVENTFVDDYWFMSTYSDETYHIGGIAGIAQGDARISNSEARGRIETSVCKSGTSMGGLVGMMKDNAEIHSSIAIPEMSGNAAYAGGIVGKANAGTALKNSFANPKLGSTAAATGGLVGDNAGTVENCYVRLQGTTEPTYWFAATNTGSIQYCYAPDGETNYAPAGGTLEGHGNYSPTALVDGKYGYMQQDQQVTATNDYVENGVYSKEKGLTGLLLTLNNWVKAQPAADGYATWTRTMASDINGDYPVHAFDAFSNTASRDGVYLEYKDDVNTTVERLNAYGSGGDIYLYKSDTLKTSTNGNVRIHIGEDVGVVTNSESVVTNARVGVTFDNSDGGWLGGLPYDWHMFSTPLADAPLGITYHDMSTHQYGYVIPESAITLNADGYFPTNTPFRSFDYYCYSERDYHWINFKRSGNDHWQQNEPHGQIHYNDINNQGTAGNEATLIPGKGYMMAVDKETMLMADGKLNNGTVTYKATNSDLGGYEAPLKGVNLIGNPYQSYLSFDEFVNANTDKVYGNTYYILDADSSKYLAYTAGSTDNGIGAPGYLHPHQGFFVRVADAQTTLEFTNAMRSVEGNADTHFRGERPAYPLVNMECTDAKGMKDYATIELNRPEQGGGQKIGGLRTGDASVWFHLDDEDWQTAFTREGLQTAPLRFEAHADGTYTMRWNTLNGDFSYLHLVDNKTGTDTDCLLTEEYRFTATTHDYLSRFTLVFECTGVEENGPSAGSESFAFMMGDELVVNGEGMLQVYDISGRLLVERELHGTQSTVSMPRVSNGMYLLRLRSANQVRVQKMVINK